MMHKIKLVKPRKYQKDAVETISDGFAEGHRAWLCADDTGLGKSGQALLIAQNVMKLDKTKEDKILIICPAFLRGKWAKEVAKWLPAVRSWSIIIKAYSEVIDPETQNYLTRYRYGLLILDESHYLMSFESQRTLAVFGEPSCQYTTIVKKCRHVLGLTATPLPQGRVGQIYPWLWATKHPTLKGYTYETFVKKWAGKWHDSKFGLRHSGVNDPEAVKKILWSRMVRRKKHDVLKELPAATRDVLTLTCSPAIYKQERAMLEKILEMSGHNRTQIKALINNPDVLETILSNVPSFEQLSVFKKQQGLFKIKHVMNYLIESVLPDNRKFILFCYHKDVADAYFEALTKKLKKEKYDTPVTLITGETHVDERLEIIDQANKDDEHILICSMHAVKEGYDMIGFNTSFYCELDWTPATHEQTEGRTLRFGQKLPVYWFYFIFDKGIEQHIFKTLQEKMKTIKKLIG